MQPDYSLRQRAYARLRLIKDAEHLGNVSAACRRHRISRKAYYKWLKRYDGTIESLMDRPRTPRSHPKKLSAELHALIKRVYNKQTKTDKPGNPTGKVFSEPELLHVAEQCEMHKAWIVTDETDAHIN